MIDHSGALKKASSMAFASVWIVLALACVASAAPPNILLIITDDQGYWDLSATGNPHMATPNIDRLAAEGVQFTRFYVQPVCAPTRAGLMTGRYYLRTGLYNTRFGGDSLGRTETTMAELLKRAGYRTGLFGKWHLGRYPGYQPQQRGFDEFFGFYEGHLERSEYPDQLVHNGTPVEARGYTTDLFTTAAMDFIDAKRSQRAPFFCYLAFNAPHIPHVLETSSNNQVKGDAAISKHLARGLPLREARIYAQVERIDENVGRLLAHLEQRGVARDTVIAFMSDNGGVSRFWKGGVNGAKATTYEGGVRSPLFVRWPERFPAKGRVEALTSHVDLLPTFCELGGAALPNDRPMDGRSLVPLLTAGRGTRHHAFVYHTWNRFFPSATTGGGISDGHYKLVGPGNNSARGGWRLFDLSTDPGEQNDLSSENPAEAARLKTEFERWFKEVTSGVTYQSIAIPLGHPASPCVELQASWAKPHGVGTRYVFEAYDWDSIEGWSKPGEAAEWNLSSLTAGRYEVSLAFGCRAADAGGTLKLSAGGAALEFQPTATPSADVFVRKVVGTLELPVGPIVLRAEVASCPGTELMRLNRIWLRKLE